VSDPPRQTRSGAKARPPRFGYRRVVGLTTAGSLGAGREVRRNPQVTSRSPPGHAESNALNPARSIHGRLFDLGDDLIHRVFEETAPGPWEGKVPSPKTREARSGRTRGTKRQGGAGGHSVQHLIGWAWRPLRPGDLIN